jgi:hypothetical protein
MGPWSDGMPVIALALSKSITALAAGVFAGSGRFFWTRAPVDCSRLD